MNLFPRLAAARANNTALRRDLDKARDDLAKAKVQLKAEQDMRVHTIDALAREHDAHANLAEAFNKLAALTVLRDKPGAKPPLSIVGPKRVVA